MRIKNSASNFNNNENIFTYLFLLIIFLFVDLCILSFYKPDFKHLRDWLLVYLQTIDTGLKFVYFVLFLLTFLWLFLLLYEVLVRWNKKVKAYKSSNFIKYIDFSKEGISIQFLNPQNIKKYSYKSLEFLLDIECEISGNILFSYVRHSIIKSLKIEIKPLECKQSFIIYNSPLNLNILYNLIYYSQFMNKFSFKFNGNTEAVYEIENIYGKVIEDFIKNGYQKTMLTKLYSPLNMFMVIIISVFVLFLWLSYIKLSIY